MTFLLYAEVFEYKLMSIGVSYTAYTVFRCGIHQSRNRDVMSTYPGVQNMFPVFVETILYTRLYLYPCSFVVAMSAKVLQIRHKQIFMQ